MATANEATTLAPPPTSAPGESREKTEQRSAGPVEVRLHGRRFPLGVLLFCIAVEIALVVLDYFVNYGRATDIGVIRRLFSTSVEDGLASWFAISQTLLAAVTLWAIFTVVRAGGGTRLQSLGWLLLALFFTYMAIDDGVGLHERMGTLYSILRRRNNLPTDNFPSYFWQLLFLPFFGAMGLFMLAFLWFQLRDGLARALLVVSIGLLVLAVFLDFVEGLNEHHPLNLYTLISERWDIAEFTQRRFDKPAFDTLRHFSKSIEEVLMEALANTLLWFLFLRHLMRTWPDVRVLSHGA